MASKEQFAKLFKDEHRAIRDALLNLIQAFRNRNPAKVRSFLNEVAALSGPHFRYEEEAFYPALVEVLDEEQVDKLLADHDGAIETARHLSELAQKDALTEEDARRGAKYARNLLPHVFECDGLSIIAELLPETTMDVVLDVRVRSFGANLDLLRWAEEARSRPLGH
ncbi:MAG: hemerythrin domain-containing protein [Candidatus Binatus sp.]